MTGRRRAFAAAVSFVVLAASDPAVAQPYRWVDRQGNVHYADRPPQQHAVNVENMNPAARRRAAAGPAPGPVEPARSAAEPSEAARPTSPLPASAGSAPEPTGSSRVTREPASAATPPRAASDLPAAGRPAPVRPKPIPADPGPAGSLTPAADDDAVAAAGELVKLSGADQWLDRIVTLARDEFGRLTWRLVDAETARAALARGFRRDALTSATARCLLGTLDAGEREAALTRLRSPLAQRAAHLRDEASSPEHAKVYRRFVSRLPDAPPPSSRLALVQTLERASGATGFELEMQRAVRRAVNGALRPLMVPDQTAPELDDAREASAEEVERLRFRRVTMLLFAYRAMPLGDLEALVRIARTPGRARFVEVYYGCIGTALVAAERRASLEARPLAAGRRGAR